MDIKSKIVTEASLAWLDQQEQVHLAATQCENA